MDNFHTYLKKQLLEYVESEVNKGIPLEQIEKALLDAGHHKNILDEVFEELKKNKETKENKENPAESDILGMLKSAMTRFMASASDKEIKEAKKDIEGADTEKIVEEVIEEAEVIKEKTLFENMAFFMYIVILGFFIFYTASSTGSEIVSVIIGLSPAILNTFISLGLVKFADNVPLYVSFPLLLAAGFYALAKFSGIAFFSSMDAEPLAVVNFILGFIFNITIVYVRFIKPKHMKEKIIRNHDHKKTRRKGSNKAIDELKHEFRM